MVISITIIVIIIIIAIIIMIIIISSSSSSSIIVIQCVRALGRARSVESRVRKDVGPSPHSDFVFLNGSK